jgi:two-component system, chemotaxis family, chemotaxis protein CheY
MAITVMIVDDSLFMRKILRDIVEAEGFEVIAEASDGAAALRRYKECRPHLTTLDIVMPEMNGIDALGEIMAFDPRARVVMCSAVGEESFTSAAAQRGAKGFILKPFKRQEVADVLREAAEG